DLLARLVGALVELRAELTLGLLGGLPDLLLRLAGDLLCLVGDLLSRAFLPWRCGRGVRHADPPCVAGYVTAALPETRRRKRKKSNPDPVHAIIDVWAPTPS